MGSSAAMEHVGEEEGTTRMGLRAVMEKIRSEEEAGRIEAASEIRKLTKTSSKNRRYLSATIDPLVAMLRSTSEACNEAALLALLNIAVKDERNKIKIVDAGALIPITAYLQSSNISLQECATAALLTLTASAANKPKISSLGIIPLLVKVLKEGSPQGKIDAVMALYNLSTLPNNKKTILSVQPIPPLVGFLKSCKKSSKAVEKCSALLGTLLEFEEGRNALTDEEGGVLSIVEVLEEGSLASREHAVGALLTMCESDRQRYRELILQEGAIPGLLELTVQGTPSSQKKAHFLLQLLRDSPSRPQLQADTLENIVSSIVSQIDSGDERVDKAKKMLSDMVQVSMEQSLRHLQQRAMVCNPTSEPPMGKCTSKLPMK